MGDGMNEDFLAFVLDQLEGLSAVSSRPMFGCIGLYSADVFFAIIDDGRLYFITDETNRPGYVRAGMKAFHALRSYYEVPVDVLEDDALLRVWAREAVEVQVRCRARHRRPQARSRPRRRPRKR